MFRYIKNQNEKILVLASLIFEFAGRGKIFVAVSVLYKVCLQYFLLDMKLW